jgi:nucleoside permease NupC
VTGANVSKLAAMLAGTMAKLISASIAGMFLG